MAFLCLIGLLTILVFRQFVSAEIAPFFPKGTDQGYYLKAVYQYFDFLLAHGPLTLLRAHLAHDRMQLGFLPAANLHMALLAAFAFDVFGATRMSALLVPFSSWLLLLASMSWMLAKVSGGWRIPLLGVALLYLTRFFFQDAGGIADFRMEFMAACWFGIATVFWSWFLGKPSYFLASLAATTTFFLLMFRLICVPFWGLILAPVLFLALLDFKKEKEGLYKALIPLVVLIFAVIGLLYWDRAFIINYYWVAQRNEAPIRNLLSVIGVGSQDYWLYYPKSFLNDQFGLSTLLIGAGSIALVGWMNGREKISPAMPSRVVLFGLWTIFCPLLVLSLGPARAGQVSGIVVSSTVLVLTVLVATYFSKALNRIPMIVLMVFVGVAFFTWQRRLSASAPFQGDAKQEALKLNAVFDRIATELNQSKTPTPEIAVLNWIDGLDHNAVFLYEREHLGTGRLLEMEIPRVIFARTQSELLDSLSRADVVVSPEDTTAITAPWPVMGSIRENFPVLLTYIHKHFRLSGQFKYLNVTYDLYTSNVSSTI